MATITTSCIEGGIVDPYATVYTYEFPLAGIEAENFIDNLVVTDSGGNTITTFNITATPLYTVIPDAAAAEAANVFNFIGYTVSGVGTSSVTANIFGDYSGIFPDKTWSYRNFDNDTSITVVNDNNIPNENIGLFRLVPSRIRYVEIRFDIEYEDSGGGSGAESVYKRVINLWERDRLRLVELIDRETTYRSSH